MPFKKKKKKSQKGNKNQISLKMYPQHIPLPLNTPKSFDPNYRKQFMQNHSSNLPYKSYVFKKK